MSCCMTWCTSIVRLLSIRSSAFTAYLDLDGLGDDAMMEAFEGDSSDEEDECYDEE